MSAKSKLKKSRENRKQKAVERGKSERYQRKERLRIRKERDRYKDENEKLKKQLEKERQINTAPQFHNREEPVYISLLLFFVARISFRAVSGVPGILSDYPGIKKTPCPQTVISRSIRLSIVRIRNSSHMAGSRIEKELFSEGFIRMIDAGIGLGDGKIPALPALKAGRHVLNKNAPTLKSVYTARLFQQFHPGPVKLLLIFCKRSYPSRGDPRSGSKTEEPVWQKLSEF